MPLRPEKIIIKITSSEIGKIEAIIEKMALIPSVEMTPLTYGQLGSDIIASFDIDEGHFAMMVEKLYSAGHNVLPTNDKVTQILEFLYGKYGKKSFLKPSTQPTTSASSTPSSSTIEEYRNSGKYEELMKIIKMVNVDSAIKDEAKNAILDSVKKCIDQNYNSAFVSKHSIPASITSLIKICSDINLKTFNLQSMQKHAGLSAIAICENYPDYRDELIKIYNNNQIPNIINLKAAIKFWTIISKNVDKLPGVVAAAVKVTNPRFLENAYDIAHIELDENERTLFLEFQNFIKTRKST